MVEKSYSVFVAIVEVTESFYERSRNNGIRLYDGLKEYLLVDDGIRSAMETRVRDDGDVSFTLQRIEAAHSVLKENQFVEVWKICTLNGDCAVFEVHPSSLHRSLPEAEIPPFARQILATGTVSASEKRRFIELYLVHYLKDEAKRKADEGKTFVVYDQRIESIVEWAGKDLGGKLPPELRELPPELRNRPRPVHLFTIYQGVRQSTGFICHLPQMALSVDEDLPGYG